MEPSDHVEGRDLPTYLADDNVGVVCLEGSGCLRVVGLESLAVTTPGVHDVGD